MHALPNVTNADPKLTNHVGDANNTMTAIFGKPVDALYRSLRAVSHRVGAYDDTAANNKDTCYNSFSELKRQKNS